MSTKIVTPGTTEADVDAPIEIAVGAAASDYEKINEWVDKLNVVTMNDSSTGGYILGTQARDGSVNEYAVASKGNINSLTDAIAEKQDAINATESDIGYFLSPKAISGGKVTEWQFISIDAASGVSF